MSLDFRPIEYFRTKFYQKEREFKKFDNVDIKTLLEIVNKVYRKQEIAPSFNPHTQKHVLQSEVYQRTLEFLTSYNIHSIFRTWDERLAFLILATDPNLVSYREYLKTDIPSMSSIERIENEKERNQALQSRHKILIDMETRIREQIGFYDAKLVKFEEVFFKKFHADKELITDVKQNNINHLLSYSKYLRNFNSITDERYQELVSIAQIWLSMIPEGQNSRTAAYSVLNQKDLIGLQTLAEQYALYILITDPDLDMLRIFEEESFMPKVQERIEEEFGYYNQTMLRLERQFHEQFCPEKKLSPWSDLK